MSARHHRKQPLVLGLLAALQVMPGFAQPADPVRILVDQGTYWQSRGDSARAAESWQKLLGISPRNPDALYGLAQAELDSGRPDTARTYLEQLRRASPNYPRLSRLEQDIATGRSGTQIQQARQQARSGKAVDALASYQSVLGGREPEGPLALEYYQTLGATPQGWDEARRGLERLARQSPEDNRIALALAQHLSYREATRRDGIAQLSRLASRSDVGKQADESWRKALAWTGSRPADTPLYQAYLKAHPDDTAIRARLDAIEQQQREGRTTAVVSADPLRQAATAAFKSLDAGDIDAAEAGFQRVLAARPDDGDALGGLGILRLRQENFSEARDLLERASRRGSAGRWRSALNSASYWTLVGQAQAARERGDEDTAAQTLAQAVRIDPAEPTGQIALGDTLSARGQYDQAETVYQQVLSRQADNPDALRGLVGALSQNGKTAEALSIVERLSPKQQEQVGGDLGRLRASQSVAAARTATQRGDDNAARVALEDALLNDPASPWVRLDLARLYLKAGAVAEARGVVDGLLVSNPNMPEALYASALLASETGDWPGALGTLERIPASNRTRDMVALQRRAWVQVQAAQATQLARQGQNAQARALLAQAEAFAAQDTELLGAVAGAYVDAGDSNRALAMIRQLFTRSLRPDVGLQLSYASILLKTRQDVELAGVLRQLQSTPMNASQRQGFDDLRVAYVVRQADALREAGDLVTAYDTLAPLLAERPDDVQVVGALARMYTAAGDHAQALATYRPLLQRQPNNLELLLSVAGAATAAKDWRDAEAAVDAALLRAPQSPEALAAAGRLARAQGKNTRAGELFTASLQAENQQRARVAGAAGLPTTPARASNPFAGRPGQRAQPAAASASPFGAAPLAAASPFGAAPAYVPPAPAYAQPVYAAGYAATAAPAGYAALPQMAYPAPAVATPPPPPQLIPQPAGANRFAPTSALQQVLPVETYAAVPQPARPYVPVQYAPQSAQAQRVATTAAAGVRDTPRVIGASTAERRSAAAAASVSARAAQPGTGSTGPAPVPAPMYASTAAPMAPAPSPSTLPAGGYLPMPAMAQPAQPAYVPAAPVAAPASYSAWGSDMPSARMTGGISPQSGAGAGWNSPPSDAPRTVRDELSEIQQAQSASITIGAVARFRQGETGTSQLSDGRMPVELRVPIEDAQLVLRITPVLLSAGTPDSAFGNLSRFGGGPDPALNQATRSAGSQNGGGVGVAVAYESERFQADLGTTPLGFRQPDVNGGLRFKGPIADSDFSYGIDLSRRAVTDSLLAFAGARDGRNNLAWGGVSATGARLQLGWDNRSWGAYGFTALHAITGTNVQSNSRLEAGGGVYAHIVKSSNTDLTAGLALNALTYDKNLRYFTYGHGGYFSPQQYFSAAVPVEFIQRTGRLSYQLRGSLGVQHFKEDPVAYFPTSGSLQSAAQAAITDAAAFGLLGTGARAVYPGQTKTGLGYNVGAAMEYQVGQQTFLGGHLAADNASNFRQFVGGLYLRYSMQPYTGPAALPVQPFRSPYGY